MRHIRFIAPLIALALLIGCSGTPNARYTKANYLLGAAEGALATSSTSGLLPDEVMVATEPAIRTAHGALDVCKTQLPEGGDTFDKWLDIALGAIHGLESMNQQATPQPANN